MRPTFSIICFTVLSGAGYGIWFLLGFGVALAWPTCDASHGLPAGATSMQCAPLESLLFIAGFVLITAGLLFSVGHLGKPLRAWRALSQWRSSWLSREGVAALLTYVPAMSLVAVPLAQAWRARGLAVGASVDPWLDDAALRSIGAVLALMCIVTVYCTAHIYSSLKPIRAWHNRHVTPAYLLLALHSGLLCMWALSTLPYAFVAHNPARVREIDAMLLALALTSIASLVLKHFYWRDINRDPRIDVGRATGLESLGIVRSFEQPHTEENYLTHEMGFVLARKHAAKLRRIAMLAGFAVPAALAALAFFWPAANLAAWPALVVGMLGIFVERWLFFAEAKHTVMLYYGAETV